SKTALNPAPRAPLCPFFFHRGFYPPLPIPSASHAPPPTPSPSFLLSPARSLPACFLSYPRVCPPLPQPSAPLAAAHLLHVGPFHQRRSLPPIPSTPPIPSAPTSAAPSFPFCHHRREVLRADPTTSTTRRRMVKRCGADGGCFPWYARTAWIERRASSPLRAALPHSSPREAAIAGAVAERSGHGVLPGPHHGHEAVIPRGTRGHHSGWCQMAADAKLFRSRCQVSDAGTDSRKNRIG
ncbi:unnamed protein product, partial [Urochloa humidicola]